MFQNCPQIDDDCIKKLLKIKTLRSLIVKDCMAVTPKSIPTFQKMVGLKNLNITAKSWPEAAIAELNRLPYKVKIDALREEKTNRSQQKLRDVADTFDLKDPALPP